MQRRSTFLRAVLAGAFSVAALRAPEAQARPPVKACTASFSAAQDRARAGHLREAKELYLKCARTACGTIQKKCAVAADHAGSGVAQVALVVSDASGAALVDVLVKMDGAPLTTHLDGRAMAMDPGTHEFTFGARVGEPARYVWLTRTIMVGEGQRTPIEVVMPAPKDEGTEATPGTSLHAAASDVPTSDASPNEQGGAEKADPGTHEASGTSSVDAWQPATATSHASPWPWVAGGVGLAGIGAGALLTYWGNADNAALAQCAPSCKPSSVDHIHQLYLAADHSFAAGGAAVGLAAILFATSHHRERSVASKRSTMAFDVRPAPSGVLATFGTSF